MKRSLFTRATMRPMILPSGTGKPAPKPASPEDRLKSGRTRPIQNKRLADSVNVTPCMPTVWGDVRNAPAVGLLHRATHASR